jgi:hypothetical protein
MQPNHTPIIYWIIFTQTNPYNFCLDLSIRLESLQDGAFSTESPTTLLLVLLHLHWVGHVLKLHCCCCLTATAAAQLLVLLVTVLQEGHAKLP